MRPANPQEFKVAALRECPTPDEMVLCDTAEKAVGYWRLHVATAAHFDPECECLVVLLLNTRRRLRGHQLLSTGTRDTLLVGTAEVFRTAVIAGAAAILVMHNHPSGEPQPSESDIKVTRELIRAGQLIKIDVLDHIIVGNPSFCSMRELGWFHA